MTIYNTVQTQLGGRLKNYNFSKQNKRLTVLLPSNATSKGIYIVNSRNTISVEIKNDLLNLRNKLIIPDEVPEWYKNVPCSNKQMDHIS